MARSALALLSLLASAKAQQVGTQQTETHPKITWSKCSGSGGSCTSQNAEVVIDSNWRWLHSTSGTDNCYDGNKYVTGPWQEPNWHLSLARREFPI